MRALGAFSTMTLKKWMKLQLTLWFFRVKLLGRSSLAATFLLFRLQTNRRHRKKAKIARFVLFIYIFLFPTSTWRTGLNVLVDVIIIWFHRLVFVRLVYVSTVLPMRKLFTFFVVVGNLSYFFFTLLEAHLPTLYYFDALSESTKTQKWSEWLIKEVSKTKNQAWRTKIKWRSVELNLTLWFRAKDGRYLA